VCFMLRLFASDDRLAKADVLTTVSSLLAWVLRLHPSFCLGRGLLYILNFRIVMDFEDNDASTSVFSPPILLIELLFLLFQSVLYFLGAVLLDYILTTYVQKSCGIYKQGKAISRFATGTSPLTDGSQYFGSVARVHRKRNKRLSSMLPQISTLNGSKIGSLWVKRTRISLC
jgi:hypothetical protein